MAWVNIKGHRYYRRSKRVGGRVVTEHVGRGELANLDAQYDGAKRELDRAERMVRRVGMHSDVAEFAARSDYAQNAFIEQLFHQVVKQPMLAYGTNTLDLLRQSFASSEARYTFCACARNAFWSGA